MSHNLEDHINLRKMVVKQVEDLEEKLRYQWRFLELLDGEIERLKGEEGVE